MFPTLTTVDRRNPVNWAHPLNRGRLMWFLGLPGYDSGASWHDVTHQSSAAALFTGPSWNKQRSPGGGGTVAFDGVGGHFASFTNFLSRPTTNSWTIGAWVFPTNGGAIFSLNNGVYMIDFGQFSAGNNLAQFGQSADHSFGVISQNEWHRVIIVADAVAQTSTAYVDGVAFGAQGPYDSFVDICSNAFGQQIGGHIASFANLSGFMDDFFVSTYLWDPGMAADDYFLSRIGYPGVLNRMPLARHTTTPRPPMVFEVDGATTINLADSAARNFNVFTVDAADSIALADEGGGERAVATRFVSASELIKFTYTTERNATAGPPQEFTVDAASSFRFLDSAEAGDKKVFFADAASRVAFSGGVAQGGRFAILNVTAATSFNIRPVASEYISPLRKAVRSDVRFTDRASVFAYRTYGVSAANSIDLSLATDLDADLIVGKQASTGLRLTDSASASVARIVEVSARSGFSFQLGAQLTGERNVSASSGLGLSVLAYFLADRIVSATTTLALDPSARSNGRDIFVSAATAIPLSSDPSHNQFPEITAEDDVALAGIATAEIGWPDATVGIAFSGVATATVELPGGGSVPGGDANAGLRAIAYAKVSGSFPFSYAETPNGLLMLANGVDPMLKWDGLAGRADTAGLQPPATPIYLGGLNMGTLVGTRYALCRFVDRDGNYSAPGPFSQPVNLGRDGAIEDITVDVQAARVTIRSTAHGLTNADIAVVIQGVQGLPVNGGHALSVVDADHFRLTNAVVPGGQYGGGGSWTWGVAKVRYQSVPVSPDPKVVRRQLLRNLDGSADVFYVDIDTDDLTSTSFDSDRSDEILSSHEAVPIATANELPYAARYYPPPSHKSIVASHAGRIFACGEVAVSAGNVAVSTGGRTVAGYGTEWPASLAGRLIYISGARQAWEIESVDEAAQTLRLVAAYDGPTIAYSTYAIRPAPGERRLVYYSEPGVPEAWPPWNAFAIPEVNDEIVGMFERTGFLYFVERRHIHRFTMQDEPSEGEVFTSINRGCINGRSFVQVENTTYLLDEAGIHAFDGGQATEPISTPIQTVFQADGLLGGLRVDWEADATLWHASHDQIRNTIRWFVQMEGYDAILHAICYDYRQKRWWLEQYPTPITSSTTGIVGHRRPLCGTDARRVIALGEGALDLVADGASGLAGSVTSADSTSLTDANASFPANLAGAPVAITRGPGRRQIRMIADNTSTTLTVVEPWDHEPDWQSEYQIGGVVWRWRSGWFDQLIEQEDSNPRDVMLTYQPTLSPTSLDMQLFYDHSDDPRHWAFNLEQNGVSVVRGEPNITVSLAGRTGRSGWSLQKMGGHSEVYAYGEQYLSILLTGVQCAESVRIYQVTIGGAKSQG